MSEMKEVATILNLHITHYTRAWHNKTHDTRAWHDKNPDTLVLLKRVRDLAVTKHFPEMVHEKISDYFNNIFL